MVGLTAVARRVCILSQLGWRCWSMLKLNSICGYDAAQHSASYLVWNYHHLIHVCQICRSARSPVSIWVLGGHIWRDWQTPDICTDSKTPQVEELTWFCSPGEGSWWPTVWNIFFGPLGVSGKGLKPWWGVQHSAESGTPSSVLEEKCGITTYYNHLKSCCLHVVEATRGSAKEKPRLGGEISCSLDSRCTKAFGPRMEPWSLLPWECRISFWIALWCSALLLLAL